MGSLILRSRVEAIISYILSYQKEIQVRMELLRILVILVQMLSLSLCGPAGQYFSSEPADTTAVAGGHLQLECVVENRKGQCQWTKDGFGLGLDPDIPGFPRFSMSDMLEVEEGEEVVLDCESHGARPAAEIHWTDDNGREIVSNLMETVTKIKKTKTFKTVSTLRMKPTRPMSLTCSASNAVFKEPKNSRALEIQLKYKPKLELNMTSEIIKEGQNLVVKCNTQAYPKEVTYKWFINDDEMKETSNILTMENVGKELNNAELRCEAENSVGKSMTGKILNIEFVPKILTHPTSVIAKHGDEVTLSCLAEGNPEPSYIWMKGKSQELVGVSPELKLTASEDTEDEYTCKVFVDGHDILTSETATLRILRTPGPRTTTLSTMRT